MIKDQEPIKSNESPSQPTSSPSQPTSSPSTTSSQPTSVFDGRFVTACYGGHDCTAGKNITFSVNHEEDRCDNCWETCFKRFGDGSHAHTQIKSIYIPEGVETRSYMNCLGTWTYDEPSYWDTLDEGACTDFGEEWVVHFEFSPSSTTSNVR